MSMRGEPASQDGSAKIEEALTELNGSVTLRLLGITTDDLDAALTDSALFETLTITHKLLVVLRAEGALGTFLLLPKDEQANFVRWLGATDDEQLRLDRTQTFVSALRESPLANSARSGDPE